jgi:hypothetical protein
MCYYKTYIHHVLHLLKTVAKEAVEKLYNFENILGASGIDYRDFRRNPELKFVKDCPFQATLEFSQ